MYKRSVRARRDDEIKVAAGAEGLTLTAFGPGRNHVFLRGVAPLEAGWRSDSRRFGTLSADAFYTWWDNAQADTLRPDGLIATRNASYARIVGIEATLSHAFSPVWRITLWATTQAALLIRNGLGIRVGGCPGGLHLGVREIGPARLSFDPALDRPMGNLIESEIGACVVVADAVVLIRILPGHVAPAFGDSAALARGFGVAPARVAVIVVDHAGQVIAQATGDYRAANAAPLLAAWHGVP